MRTRRAACQQENQQGQKDESPSGAHGSAERAGKGLSRIQHAGIVRIPAFDSSSFPPPALQ